jgi:hypothetical protein
MAALRLKMAHVLDDFSTAEDEKHVAKVVK